MPHETTDTDLKLTDDQLDDIQGDIWSKGFPKYYETYYFFSISRSNVKLFSQCLKDLATHSPPLISTLRKVKGDCKHISDEKEKASASVGNVKIQKIPVSNALIAFTSEGLKLVSAQIKGAHHQALNFLRSKLAFKNQKVYV